VVDAFDSELHIFTSDEIQNHSSAADAVDVKQHIFTFVKTQNWDPLSPAVDAFDSEQHIFTSDKKRIGIKLICG